MGAAYYLSFEREVPGFEPATALDGKELLRSVEKLDGACRRAGVAAVSSFFSESVEEGFEKIGEDPPEGLPSRPIQWSKATEGIATSDALLAQFKEPKQLVDDLRNLRSALEVARDHRTRFRLRIDI